MEFYIGNTVYTVYNNHICRCKIRSVYEESGKCFYLLFNEYTGKDISFYMSEDNIFISVLDLCKKHIEDHV